MWRDPIVAEIHQIRKAHAKRFNNDIHAIFADIRRKQTNRPNLVDLSPARPPAQCVAEGGGTYGVDK
ncbi:MAG: hypothetical protein A3K19_25845 [Lentisphaerae bacterium RIFOXYB12_FULL_65_16]|nr:MAG: hypothetical protein A3K18_31845 [Lentisphaerae bacterium RIFOXYA12_64_32]OGV91394.1 MAG: hypothetical protein A3K19_25845 [Lentisphaerae bacterium RIFOXYB12_FULL_65_16]